VLANSVMGMALMLAGDGNGAVSHLQSAHQAAPNDVRITRMFAQVLGEAGHAKEGLPIAEQLAVSAPNSPQAEYLVGWLQSKAGTDHDSLQQAVQHLTKALSLDSDYAPASGALGVALARMGSPDTAITLLERARQGGSFDLDTARALADASAKLKRPNAPELAAQARDMAASDDKLQKARGEWLAHPDNMKNTLALARMEGARGDLPDAREMVIGILKNDPNQPEALSILEELMARR
jgi:Flp pilus assembly protein TadD